MIRSLIDRGVKVNVLNVGLLDQTPMGKFFITTLLAAAELERSMILERMQEGKAIVRTKQKFREGRPPIDRARKEHTLALLRGGRSYKDVVAVTNLSVSTLSRYVRKNARRAVENEN
ncbi:recombinase family protein [uncultured Selenomonas sp.]|uniref:recombinase family protein n=1 Tax=uncultured Selenomonas sp. TaxID=159275 RepID=UPI0028E6C0AA|nr:recombinase family protein [uncultured Selenomonas sp.]